MSVLKASAARSYERKCSGRALYPQCASSASSWAYLAAKYQTKSQAGAAVHCGGVEMAPLLGFAFPNRGSSQGTDPGVPALARSPNAATPKALGKRAEFVERQFLISWAA